MKKLFAVLALWFYVGWAFWGLMAGLLNQTASIGPVVGLVVAIVVAAPRLVATTPRT